MNVALFIGFLNILKVLIQMCGNQQNETKIKLHSIEEAIEDIRNGKS